MELIDTLAAIANEKKAFCGLKMAVEMFTYVVLKYSFPNAYAFDSH